MTRIRQWLKRAEDCRRTYVKVEKRDPEREEAECKIAADARHGILPFAGRRVS